MTNTPEKAGKIESAAKPEIRQAAKQESPKMGPVPTGHEGNTGSMDPPPNGPHRRYDNPKPKIPVIPFDKFQRTIMNMSNALGKLITKGLLVAAVLTSWAKKETPEATADNQSPKATLTAGALGMTLMKTQINNGNRTTDFDGKLILAETAHEVVNKLTPELTTKPFFEKNPIENGVFGKKAKDLLAESSQKQDQKHTMTIAEMAEKFGKGPKDGR